MKTGFIGFGLIGGSIALTLREKSPDCSIIAYQYKNKRDSNLEQAKADGVLNKISVDLMEDFSDCDIIFLCAPVLSNISYLNQLKPIIGASCILTDVGSVKQNIHEAVNRLGLEKNFIGGHPMAGSEKTGYANAAARLLENAFYILTPTQATPRHVIDKMTELVQNTGAIPVILDAEKHDMITAAISHVPHILAASLVNMVGEHGEADQMRLLSAGGFRDITRIASSSPVMWQDICLSNAESICALLKQYRNRLEEMETAIRNQDGESILHAFEGARDFRDSIPNKPVGILSRIFEVYVDIADETGAIATIAAILASRGISIKNIGILHNREFQEGVLRIELYDYESTERASELLKQNNYVIYER